MVPRGIPRVKSVESRASLIILYLSDYFLVGLLNVAASFLNVVPYCDLEKYQNPYSTCYTRQKIFTCFSNNEAEEGELSC